MNITKALADENRVRMLLALRKGELCVCQVIELFGLAPSTVSKHLSVLYQAGLAESRKEGRWIYFRLPDQKSPAGVKRALDWILRAAEGEPRILEDEEKLRRILKVDLAELCKRQCCK